VVSDTVFSVDGTLAPVSELHAAARAHRALLVLDEAHAFGVVGPGGRGAAAAAGIAAEPDLIRTVTLSKSLAGQGGAVLGAAEVTGTLVDTGRGFIFDTGLAPPCAGAALAALRVLAAEPARGARAQASAARLAAIATGLGWPTPAPGAAVLAVVIGGFLWWNADHPAPQRYATGHGEQKTWRLADNSVLRLNTDTAVTVRYRPAERLIEIDRGQAFFEVVHEPTRRFRVVAGATNIVAVGTQFDVYRDRVSTVVTVVEGQVTVASDSTLRRELHVNAGGQVRVIAGRLPDHATPVDTQRSTAWLRRQIAFDQEPLAAVAAEFNRYGAVPIEIETPSLNTLVISGVFAADDTETFLAFLRTLDDVTVETTSTRIRVFRHPDQQ